MCVGGMSCAATAGAIASEADNRNCERRFQSAMMWPHIVSRSVLLNLHSSLGDETDLSVKTLRLGFRS